MCRRSFRPGIVMALLAGALVLAGCTSKGGTPASGDEALTPVLSIKELMEGIIDPQADLVFDAVAIDAGPNGVVETKPTSDDDWSRVEHGAMVLVEASNLLKMRRAVAPPGHRTDTTGADGPELSAAEIERRIADNRGLWNTHADQLRNEALRVVQIVKARDSDALFDAGSQIDRVCESCHLDYWYPGEKASVLKERESRSFADDPAGASPAP